MDLAADLQLSMNLLGGQKGRELHSRRRINRSTYRADFFADDWGFITLNHYTANS
jgi:hypothetical protein